jgi:4-hydroxy-2-oxoheptanedioate aldolase
MRPSLVKAKLRHGQPAVGVALSFTDPVVYELTSLMGFDFIWMDLEHHALSVETAGHLLRAARVGRTDVMCRPAKGELMRMGRLLEFGAHGIMYPRCQSAEEARQVVQWAKFAPLGTRGFDGGNPDNPYCRMGVAEYIRMANEETWIVAQIEDPQALERVDEIAAVDGIDVVMLGPADFSILAGVPGQFDHPKLDDALQRIASAAKRHGKAWGTPTGTPQRMKQLIDRGAQWVTCGCDLIWVKNGLEQAQRDLAELGMAPAPTNAQGASCTTA